MTDFQPKMQPVAGRRRNVIELKGVTKSFRSAEGTAIADSVLESIDLCVAKGEIVTIFGPNGCGKSTLLNVLAGLLTPESGSVGQHLEDSLSPSLGYVFQNHSDTLLPWKTVRENVAFPLELQAIRKEDLADRVKQILTTFHLTAHAEKYVYELSGGLKQLVAIARATVYNPQILLLDEPFSALDYSLSRRLWIHFRSVFAESELATVFVSHNIDEAIFLGDRIVVLSGQPARVVADISIPFGGSRSLSLLSSLEFFELRRRVLDVFEGSNKRNERD